MAPRINHREIRKYFEYNNNESTHAKICEMQKEITEINETENNTKCWFISKIFQEIQKEKSIYMRIKRTIKIDCIKRAIETTNIYENKFNNLDEIENSLKKCNL